MEDPGAPSPPPPRLPPAGWYPDPDAPDTRQRYWDGSLWADSYAPIETPFVDPHNPPKSLRNVRNLAFAGIAAVVLLEVASIVADARLVSLLDDEIGGGNPDPFDVDDARDLADGTSTTSVIALVIIGSLTFLPWFYRAYQNLRRLGVRTLRYEVGWAVGSWFIPIFNLFRPKQIANDLYRVTAGAKLHAKAPIDKHPVSPLLHWWWAVWILAFVVGQIGSFYVNTEESDIFAGERVFDTPGDERAFYLGDLISGAVTIAAAVLAMMVVQRITADQEAVIAAPAATVGTYVTPPPPAD